MYFLHFKKALKGFGKIDRNDNESKYYIFGAWTNRWQEAFVMKYPYVAVIDGVDLCGQMTLLNKNPVEPSLSARGDSGAAVVNTKSELVGMLYGGCYITGFAFVTPIECILKAFKDFNFSLVE